MTVSDSTGKSIEGNVTFKGDSQDPLEGNMPEHSSPEVRAAREAFHKLGMAAESNVSFSELAEDQGEDPVEETKPDLSKRRFSTGLQAGAILGVTIGAIGFLINPPAGILCMVAFGGAGAALGDRVEKKSNKKA